VEVDRDRESSGHVDIGDPIASLREKRGKDLLPLVDDFRKDMTTARATGRPRLNAIQSADVSRSGNNNSGKGKESGERSGETVQHGGGGWKTFSGGWGKEKTSRSAYL